MALKSMLTKARLGQTATIHNTHPLCIYICIFFVTRENLLSVTGQTERQTDLRTR